MSLHKKYENNLNIVAGNLMRIRTEKNISLANLSDKLMLMDIDISKQSLYRIEKNKRSIRDNELTAIAKAFGVKIEDLVENFIKDIT